MAEAIVLHQEKASKLVRVQGSSKQTADLVRSEDQPSASQSHPAADFCQPGLRAEEGAVTALHASRSQQCQIQGTVTGGSCLLPDDGLWVIVHKFECNFNKGLAVLGSKALHSSMKVHDESGYSYRCIQLLAEEHPAAGNSTGPEPARKKQRIGMRHLDSGLTASMRTALTD